MVRARGWALAGLFLALFAGCPPSDGGSPLGVSYSLESQLPGTEFDGDLELCCDVEGKLVTTILVTDVGDRDAAGDPVAPFHPSQFEGSSPEPDTKYLAFSLADVSPPGALSFRWNGPFIADGHRDANGLRQSLVFDPDVDVGEPPTADQLEPQELGVSAARCDFETASFTMIVFEFAYTGVGSSIITYRTHETRVEVVNTCYVPLPPPPDGDLIVFSNKQPGEDTEIWVIDAFDGGATQLTHNTREDWDPAWSPDRFQIAFVSNSQGTGTSLDLMVMDFDGTAAGVPTPLTDFGGTLSARDPAWSPAPGVRKVAVAAGAQGYFDRIQIFDLDQPAGTPPVEISTLPQRDIEHLSWAPEGDQIAFCNAGAIYKVSTVNPPAPTAVNSNQDWSLDWAATGLVMHRYSNSHPGRFNIVKADRDGNGVTNVTTLAAQETYSDNTPSWSPALNRIVFVRRQNDESFGRLRIVNPNGDNNLEIADQPAGSNTEPDWGFGPLP